MIRAGLRQDMTVNECVIIHAQSEIQKQKSPSSLELKILVYLCLFGKLEDLFHNCQLK